MHLDDRLPDLVEITDSNRQQIRRITSHPTPCGKCKGILDAENVCFADGRDCHRSCAEFWNREIIDSFEILLNQDVEARDAEEAQKANGARVLGLIVPDEESLWTPPSMTPAATGTA